MKIIGLIVLFIFHHAYAGLESPFPSTVSGITIQNTHTVGFNNILRGMNPLGKVQELRKAGVTDVLIFKNQTHKLSPPINSEHVG